MMALLRRALLPSLGRGTLSFLAMSRSLHGDSSPTHSELSAKLDEESKVFQGSFGTKEYPSFAVSQFPVRQVACIGGVDDDHPPHAILWMNLLVGPPMACHLCGQVFKLLPFVGSDPDLWKEGAFKTLEEIEMAKEKVRILREKEGEAKQRFLESLGPMPPHVTREQLGTFALHPKPLNKAWK